MKIDEKRVIELIVISTVLVAGIVMCSWLYSLFAQMQMIETKDWINPVSITLLMMLCLIVGLLYSGWKRISDSKSASIKCKEAYTLDALTGLYNKRGFEAEAKKALANPSKSHAQAIVAFEIVSFRTYNELYGFEAGDFLLKSIAEIAKKHEKRGDVVARMYSDHFVWLVNGENKEEVFKTLSDSLIAVKGTGLPFYLCGGIYLINNNKMSIPEMVDKAAIAKDTIKFNYGTGIAVFDESMLECQLLDAQMVGNMMLGLINGEFIDYYQPKYNTDTECITGAEALVRWKKPDGEILTPNQFIALFERNGFIRKLDFYLFERVCAFLADEKKNGRTVLPISVNFSRVHMRELHFPQKLFDLTQKYGVDPKNIEIEITESVFGSETKDTSKVVNKLHEYGFSVAIDDFGSGFSALNMLKDFDFDTLKIDTKFLEGFERGGKVGTVVASVIRMAKWLGIPVVAEGVETREQVDFLRTLGCETIQGYYFSRPVPREEFEILIAHGNVDSKTSDKPEEFNVTSVNDVLGGDSLVTSILDGILGGFGIYEFSGNTLEAIRVNRAYYEMMGYPDSSAFREHSLNVVTQVYPQDADRLIDACSMAVKTGKVQKLFARRYKYDGTLSQFDCLIKHIGGSKEKPFICMTFIDATERLCAERENELNKYFAALHGIFDEIFEFNYNKGTLCLLDKENKKCLDESRNLSAAEKNWFENIIHPDDRKRIERLASLARTNEIELPFTTDYRVIKDGQTRWISAYMVSITGGSYLLCNRNIL